MNHLIHGMNICVSTRAKGELFAAIGSTSALVFSRDFSPGV
jgi:hypothetical protein